MIIDYVWPKDDRYGQDCFWIQCTEFEMENQLVPVLRGEELSQYEHYKQVYYHDICRELETEKKVVPLLSKKELSRYQRYKEELFLEKWKKLVKTYVDEQFCFLVGRRLSPVKLTSPNYPLDNLWNAYSPFVLVETIRINQLSEIENLTYKIITKLGID